ncbi:HisA/HisF-related TIM barrel protein [Alkalilacustris brevis]|uniref:1-(5-phosphoribosyl)-5-[(5- phosphoribosylamino)methylideneamino]imidazole-4- carboxamide isomerase n=1 Tax=Alkalilacustris brevis TaxID=2026338 RepID=UPI000E0DD7BF|nr:1-(5-phosphoribosyl)-5-[(5-phosphoribosylamino)methylideneamino] imidazole-4-carboxamide isomerase [Alkalilacustris brevis]
MIIYPTIELWHGHCVSLTRGRLDEPVIWHVDPLAKARDFAAAGASWMQVTDFDAVATASGTEGPEGDNAALIEEIIRTAGIPVQVAGGIRSLARARHWLEAGAGRVVIGTAAVLDPAMVLEAAKYHPDQIVLAVDVYQGRVMSAGWKEASAFAPLDFLAHFEAAPLAAVLITDIDADVGDSDATLGLVSGLAGSTRQPVIASGMVRTLDDLSRLKYVGNVAGAVVGRALFNRTLELEEALALAAEPTEPQAEFR